MADTTRLTGIQRIHVVNVPIDIIPEGSFEHFVDEMVSNDKPQQIVLLRLWDLMRARADKEFGRCVRQAALVVPVSKGIVAGARFLKKHAPVRYMPFDFVIKLLGALENKGRSIYILGGDRKHLQRIEQNLRRTFPGLRLVGRYTGFYESEVERDIVTAIKKSSPDLLFTGSGIRGRDKWAQRHRNQFDPRIMLWSGECFDIFSERRKRPSRRSFRAGLDFLPDFFRKPWRIFRLFVYAFYGVLLVIHRIRHL